MATRATYLAVAALLASFALASSAPASNLSFLGKSPLTYFKGDDMKLMRQNVEKVLDDPGAGAKQSWSNPKTGASGLAEVREQFTGSDGAPCKRLRVLNKAGGVEGDALYTLCKYADRGWVIHTDASAAH